MTVAASIPGGLRLPTGEITPGKRHRRTLAMRNALVARGFELSGKRVLNVGCGEGLHSLYMAEFADEVVSIDHDEKRIVGAKATANALGIENTKFISADVRDPNIYEKLGRFDLAIAWGFLHRVSDIFSFLYQLEPLSDTLSFEWRTPVVPMMSMQCLAYHYPGGESLDPMNVKRFSGKNHGNKKVEGETGFWEPTPGAVKAIMQRLRYRFNEILGYGDDLVDESTVIARHWSKYLASTKSGQAKPIKLSTTRVHMISGKSEGIRIKNKDDIRFPEWDIALMNAADKSSNK